jgi:hypothetical protein
MVDDRWREVVKHWGIGSVVSQLTVVGTLTLNLHGMLQDVVSSKKGDSESQGVVGIEGFDWHTKQLVNRRKPISNITQQRLGVEAVILSELGTSDFGTKLLRGEDNIVGLWIVHKT